MIIDGGDFHSSAPIVGPENTVVLIRDMRKDNPFWKFAGGKKQLIKPFGKKQRGETPLECLLREIKEETSLSVRKSQAQYVTTEDKGNHNKHYFLCRIASFRRLFTLSNEYEEPKIFSLEDLMWLPNFHPSYRDIFFKHMLPLIKQGQS